MRHSAPPSQEERTLLPSLAAGKLDLPLRLPQTGAGPNAVEIPKFDPLIAEWEERIAKLRDLKHQDLATVKEISELTTFNVQTFNVQCSKFSCQAAANPTSKSATVSRSISGPKTRSCTNRLKSTGTPRADSGSPARKSIRKSDPASPPPIPSCPRRHRR